MKLNFQVVEVAEQRSAIIIRHPHADLAAERIARRQIIECARVTAANYQRLQEIAAEMQRSADSIAETFRQTDRAITAQRHFGARCRAAMALDDVEEMVRRRDELVLELAAKSASRRERAHAG